MTDLDMPAVEAAPSRRALFGFRAGPMAGIAAAGVAALATQASAQTPVQFSRSRGGLTDGDILNFALNLEYLESEFYMRATGQMGGARANLSNPTVIKFADNVARNESAHVRFLQSALGPDAARKPQIDLRGGFSAVAQAAGLGGGFDPFASDLNFLLAAFLFEDVGVTAYKGAAPLIRNRDFLKAAAGIHATEAYHAGFARAMLYRMGPQARAGAAAISRLRDKLDGPYDLDQGLERGGHANIVPSDSGGVAFSRTPEQVLNIVYGRPGKGVSRGGFFPDGTTGRIQMT